MANKSAPPENRIRLTPLVRLAMTTNAEMRLDKMGIFSDDLKSKYIERLESSEQIRDNTFRSFFTIEALLLFVLTGTNLVLPFFGVKTSDIPAILEMLTILASLAAIFVVISSVNFDAYHAILRQFGNRAAATTDIDPDFVIAADSQTQLFLKILRAKFNYSGKDIYISSRGFELFSGIVYFLIYIMLILFPILHFSLIYLSIKSTYEKYEFGFIIGMYVFTIVLCNLLALLIFVGSYKQFEFLIYDGNAPMPVDPEKRRNRLLFFLAAASVVTIGLLTVTFGESVWRAVLNLLG